MGQVVIHHGIKWVARGWPVCPECNSNKNSFEIKVTKSNQSDYATYKAACVCDLCGCEYSYTREVGT